MLTAYHLCCIVDDTHSGVSAKWQANGSFVLTHADKDNTHFTPARRLLLLPLYLQLFIFPFTPCSFKPWMAACMMHRDTCGRRL